MKAVWLNRLNARLVRELDLPFAVAELLAIPAVEGHPSRVSRIGRHHDLLQVGSTALNTFYIHGGMAGKNLVYNIL